MRAWEVRGRFGLDALTLAGRPDPSPGPGEVLLSMRAASLNYRDLLVIEGAYNPRFPLPLVPGSDGVGAVVAVGAGVTRAKVGDRVVGMFAPAWVDGPLTEAKARSALGGANPGVLSELVVLPEQGVVPVPDGLSDEEAATLPCAALTAWSALVTHGQLAPGEAVLIQGTGGVSIFALQFAKLAGARAVITSSRDDKLARARALGADETVNYRTHADWGDRARKWTGGGGVDLVVEVGGAGTMAQSLRAVRMDGRIALIGVLAGRGEFDPVPILMRNVRLQGIHCGSRAMFEAMARAIERHRLRPVIDRTFPFDELPAALLAMKAGAHFGKIAVRF